VADSLGDVAAKEASHMPVNPASNSSSEGVPHPPPPPSTSKIGTETHKWKLADGVWAEITITGAMGLNGFEKLKRYVDLIDVSSADAAE